MKIFSHTLDCIPSGGQLDRTNRFVVAYRRTKRVRRKIVCFIHGFKWYKSNISNYWYPNLLKSKPSYINMMYNKIACYFIQAERTYKQVVIIGRKRFDVNLT